MPVDHKLNLMAEMFGRDLQDPRDRYTTSTFALAICAPGCISEFQDLTVDCLHEEKDSKGELRLDSGSRQGKAMVLISNGLALHLDPLSKKP